MVEQRVSQERISRLIEEQNLFTSDGTLLGGTTRVNPPEDSAPADSPKHSCGKPYTGKNIGVDLALFGRSYILIHYCRNCGVYVVGEGEEQREFNSAANAGEYLTSLKMKKR